MKTLFLLITLTQNGAGDINASFVNTETLEQCQQKATMVEAVFKGSNIPVIESRCISSDMQFSEFGHASTASKIRNYYLISINNEQIKISVMPDWRSCMHAQNRPAEKGRVYCSSSIQAVQ